MFLHFGGKKFFLFVGKWPVMGFCTMRAVDEKLGSYISIVMKVSIEVYPCRIFVFRICTKIFVHIKPQFPCELEKPIFCEYDFIAAAKFRTG